MNELEQYLVDNKFSKRFKFLKNKFKNKKIVIYGAGQLFQTIIKKYDLSDLNIVGICDKTFSSAENGELYFGFPKIDINSLALFDFDNILVAVKDYVQIIYDLPDEINKNCIYPFVKKNIWFKYVKGARRRAKYLTLFNHTFVIPFSPAEMVLNYLERENPWMAQSMWSPRNLNTYMVDIAARSTAQYVIDNMSTLPAFDDRFKLLSYALRNVPEDGLYFEFGVYKGESINYIAGIKSDKTIYGFDSFEGLPESWTANHQKGHFKLPALPKVRKNVELVKGWFDETIPAFRQKHGDFKVAFIHADSDLYSSTKTMFNLLKDNITTGTIVVFDEYFNYPNWEKGEFRAFQEFINENNLKYEYIGYTYKSSRVAIRFL